MKYIGKIEKTDHTEIPVDIFENDLNSSIKGYIEGTAVPQDTDDIYLETTEETLIGKFNEIGLFQIRLTEE